MKTTITMTIIIIFNVLLITTVLAIFFKWLMRVKDAYNKQLLDVIDIKNNQLIEDRERNLEEIREEKESLRLIGNTAIHNLELTKRSDDDWEKP